MGDRRASCQDGGGSIMSRVTGLSGLASVAGMEGAGGGLHSRRRGSRQQSAVSMSSLKRGWRRGSFGHHHETAQGEEEPCAVHKRVNKLRSWAHTVLRNSVADRRRIRAMLEGQRGSRLGKELRNWPLTLDEEGRICVHSFTAAMVNLRGVDNLPPLAVLGAGLDLSDSPELAKIDSLRVDGPLDLRGARSLRRLPDDLRAYSLCASGCAELTALPSGLVVDTSVDLTGCAALTELPPTMSRVYGALSLNKCTRLTALPRALAVDESLWVAGCTELTALPDKQLRVGGDLVLDNCPKLRTIRTKALDVRQALSCKECIALERLPERLHVVRLDLTGCASIRELPADLRVDGDMDLVNCTGLTALPEGLRVGGALDLSGCSAIVALPPGLQVGTDLFLSGCAALESLPRDLRVGGDLHLENCSSLRRLPDEVFAWGFSSDPMWPGEIRNIYLAGVGLASSELERIRDSAAEGIQFYVAVDETAHVFDRFDSLEEALEAWDCDPRLAQDIGPAYRRGVLLFLSHLRISKEYEDEGMRPGLVRRVQEVLEVVAEDPESRDEIVTRMNDSVDACGDKPIWALNQMTLLRHVALARGDADRLRALGRGVMRLGVVHEHVRTKIKSLGFVDDVCVYLFYEIALREDLCLPVSATAMKFPDYIKVSREEIDQARQAALAVSPEDFERWLASWGEWQRHLRHESAPLYEEIFSLAYRDLDDAVDLSGEPVEDPVLLGGSTWSFAELRRHWIATGCDLNNTRWEIDAFINGLQRVLPPRASRASSHRLSFLTASSAASSDDLDVTYVEALART